MGIICNFWEATAVRPLLLPTPSSEHIMCRCSSARQGAIRTGCFSSTRLEPDELSGMNQRAASACPNRCRNPRKPSSDVNFELAIQQPAVVPQDARTESPLNQLQNSSAFSLSLMLGSHFAAISLFLWFEECNSRLRASALREPATGSSPNRSWSHRSRPDS